MSNFERREYKYFVPLDDVDLLRERFLNYMDYDPFCESIEDCRYWVRSIYYDTPKFAFYFEKKAGLKIRKKVRIRAYNYLDEKTCVFIEIKRKYNNIIYKNRAKIDYHSAPPLLNGADYKEYCKNMTFPQIASLERFVYLIKKLRLESKVLITYEREAFIGRDDSNLRITFDWYVRSYPTPHFKEIFLDDGLYTFVGDKVILEIKFWGRMPIWVRNVLRDFSLRQESISKYCYGIDALPQFAFLKPD